MIKLTLMFLRAHELPGGDQAQIVDLARMADDAGLYGVAVGEHLALGSSLENYPFAGGLRHPEGPATNYLEAVTVLAAFAAATSRVRLSTSVMLAPLRPAVLLAKQLASLDVLSRGRCEPVFGFGWNRDEYAALGVDFSARRRILRDNIAACRALWGEQPASFASETVSFEGLYAMPRPVQRRLPILLGCKATEENAKLVAELCDGWECGPDESSSIDLLRAGVGMLRDACRAAGRAPEELIVRAYAPLVRAAGGEIDLERSLAASGPMREAGVSHFVLSSRVFETCMSSMAGLSRRIETIARLAEAC